MSGREQAIIETRRNRRRICRLLDKLEQAGALLRLGEVMALPSWNRRFRAVQRLRFEGRVAR